MLEETRRQNVGFKPGSETGNILRVVRRGDDGEDDFYSTKKFCILWKVFAVERASNETPNGNSNAIINIPLKTFLHFG